jgi:uncharacterized protein (DUF58 family)
VSPRLDDFADEEFLKTLAYLDLTAGQIRAGVRRGERRTKQKGSGTLFREHRVYSVGDDLRYVDWNVYGRLETLFVKEFEVEEAANVYLLLDRSRSMDFGEPKKIAFARRVAAALGYIGLSHLDRVEVVPVPLAEPRAFAGKAQAPGLFHHLASLEPEGETDLFATVTRVMGGASRGGVVMLVSDLLDPKGYRRAVDFLLSRRYRVFIVQVFAEEEAEPPMRGALKLVDSETGRVRPVQVTEKVAARYREAFERFLRQARNFARKKEIGYARFRSDVPFGRAVLSVLKTGGVVR